MLGYRELGSGYGRAQDTHKVHFGLGKNPGPYTLKIRWPGQAEPQKLVMEKGGFHNIVQPVNE